MTSRDAFLDAIESEFPAFRVIPKRDSPLCHAIDRTLRVLTLGGQDRFLSEYYTVIGETLYVPDGWDTMADVDAVILLRHERVHLRQKRRLTMAGMAFVYLVPWFPLGLARGRAALEWEAYRETLAATVELKGLDAARDPGLRRRIVDRFVGPDYGWMWPFRRQVEGWYDEAIQELATVSAMGRSDREI